MSNEPRFTSDTQKYSQWLSEQLDSYINVSDPERLACLIGGGLLALLGLKRDSTGGTLLAVLGGALMHRGVTGHCYLYEATKMSTAPRRPAAEDDDDSGAVAIKPNRRETVEEASWESFPASDPPSWSGGSIT